MSFVSRYEHGEWTGRARRERVRACVANTGGNVKLVQKEDVPLESFAPKTISFARKDASGHRGISMGPSGSYERRDRETDR